MITGSMTPWGSASGVTFRQCGVSGWYEEDMDWALVFVKFSDKMPQDEFFQKNLGAAEFILERHFGIKKAEVSR